MWEGCRTGCWRKMIWPCRWTSLISSRGWITSQPKEDWLRFSVRSYWLELQTQRSPLLRAKFLPKSNSSGPIKFSRRRPNGYPLSGCTGGANLTTTSPVVFAFDTFCSTGFNDSLALYLLDYNGVGGTSPRAVSIPTMRHDSAL